MNLFKNRALGTGDTMNFKYSLSMTAYVSSHTSLLEVGMLAIKYHKLKSKVSLEYVLLGSSGFNH